jgi:hypothetical protein
MENKNNKASPPKQLPQRPTLIGHIFFPILNTVLISILGLIVLSVWAAIEIALGNSSDVLSKIQSILEVENNYIANFGISSVDVFNGVIQKIHGLCNISFARNSYEIFVSILEILVKRVSIFIAFIPFIVLVLSLMIIDGLVQRDIRKFKGERESTLYFHRLKPMATFSFYFIYFIYVCFPYPYSPVVFLLPMVVLTSMLIMLTIKHFKKYV